MPVSRPLCLTLVLGLILACGSPTGQKADQDQVVLAFPAEPATINPVFIADNVSHIISRWLFHGLTRFQPDLQLAPDLAEGWEFSPDYRRLTFFLRRGVRWHDGREVTAADVLFTFQMITSPQVPSPIHSQFGPVQQLSAPDPYTVVVEYQEPFGSALESWDIGIVPQHAFHNRPITDPGFDRAPIGTGPYRLKEWLPGQQLILEAFPDHFQGPPRLQRLIIKIIPDPTTRFMELKTGRVDVLELTPSQYAEVADKPDKWGAFVLHRCPAVRYGFLGFNHNHPAFKNPKIRQAFALAINKEAIIQGVLKGLGRPGHSPYPPGAWYSHDQLPAYPYDPLKAQKIFQELKVSLNSAITPDSPLILVTNYESRENLLTAQIIQDNLNSLGIPINIKTFDWLTFRHRVINKREFDLIVLERHFLWDPDLFSLWHSSQTKEGEWNFLNYSNPQVDRLLEEARRTIFQDRRRLIYRQIQAIMATDLPGVFLYHGDAVFLAKKALQGLAPSPLGIFSNIHHWFISPPTP